MSTLTQSAQEAISNTDNDILKEILFYIATNPIVVHGRFFAHRHPQASAAFHNQMLLDWYSADPHVQHMVFRGGAKSTIGEEALAMVACTGLAKNIPIIGSSLPRAKERLGAIKNELENNVALNTIFGNLVGPTWAEQKIVLNNNQTAVHALGWNQSMRGIKHLDWRPDYCWIDDIEDEENTKTPEARQQVVRRLLSVIIPAVDAPGARIRVTCTPLDPESLAEKLRKSTLWETRVFPAKYRDPNDGHWIASWPERRPLDDLDRKEQMAIEAGEHETFMREYMCEARSHTTVRFTDAMMKAEPRARTYEPTYAIYDPARTTGELSSHTGKVVVSWHQRRLIIWESGGYFWKPDEIVADICRVDEQYNPILVGVEQNGLHEFIMQPLRQASMQRGQPIPIRALMAPKGKLNFIQSLQPFFNAGEVTFAPSLVQHEQCTQQLLNFPSGRLDIINALAYILKMKPGMPMLDNFTDDHIDPAIRPSPQWPFYLAINSTNVHTTAVLFQLIKGQFRILRDWIAEGDVGTNLQDIVQAAKLDVMKPVKLIAPPHHFEGYDIVGLKPAAVKIGLRPYKGAEPAQGLGELRNLLGLSHHGEGAFRLSPAALWTLRALSAGFCRAIDKTGFLAPEAEEGPYRTLMEGLISGLAFSNIGDNLHDGGIAYGRTASGHSYLTAKR